MEKSDEYYSYGGEEDYDPESPKVIHDNNWGSHGWAFTLNPLADGDNPCIDKIYDSCTLIMVHYNAIMYHQREKCLSTTGWGKMTLWSRQKEFAEALEEYWNNGMRDYLSEKND